MCISAAMLRSIKSEAELAKLLAHEIVHLSRQDHFVDTAKIIPALGMVLEARNGGANEDEIAKLQRDIEETSAKIKRDSEIRADILGVQLAVKAGYSPHGSLTLLERLSGLIPGMDAPSLSLDTHPHVESRIKTLSALIESQNLDNSLLVRGETQYRDGISDLGKSPK